MKRKILSVALVLIMLISMVMVFATTALAAPGGIITIKRPKPPEAAGGIETLIPGDFVAYKIFDLEKYGKPAATPDSGKYYYTIVDEFKPFETKVAGSSKLESCIGSQSINSYARDLEGYLHFLDDCIKGVATPSSMPVQDATDALNKLALALYDFASTSGTKVGTITNENPDNTGDIEIEVDENGYYLVFGKGTVTSRASFSNKITAWVALGTVYDKETDMNVYTDDDIKITLKADAPILHKQIYNHNKPPHLGWTDWTDIGTNNRAEFRLTSKVPNMEYKDSNGSALGKYYDEYVFTVHDTMSKGLDFDPDSVLVYIGTDVYEREYIVYELDADGNLILDGGGNPIPVYELDGSGNIVLDGDGNPKILMKPNYKVNVPAIHPNPSGPDDIEHTFDIEFIPAEFAKLGISKPGVDITIYYSATLNEYAAINEDEDDDGSRNKNTANLEYSNSPYWGGAGQPTTPPTTETPPETVYVYTFDMEIFKYTGTLGAGGSAISVPGAQFTLEWEDPGDTYNPDRIIGYDNSTGVPVPIYYRGDNYKEDYYEVLPVPPDTKTRYYTVFEYIGPTATGDAEYRVVPFADVLSLAAANGTAVADELEFPPLPSGEYGKQPPPTQPYTTILTAPKDGKIYIVGLDAGDYLLKEIYTPSPFNLLDDPVEVNIEHVLQYDTTNPLNPIFYAGLQGLRTVSLTNVPSPNLPPITEENTNPTGGVAVGNGRINIQNNSGLMFPMTGGIGTAIFILVGILLMSSAVIALVIRRRMRITAEITKQQL